VIAIEIYSIILCLCAEHSYAESYYSVFVMLDGKILSVIMASNIM
jgi:hypothetical protein